MDAITVGNPRVSRRPNTVLEVPSTRVKVKFSMAEAEDNLRARAKDSGVMVDITDKVNLKAKDSGGMEDTAHKASISLKGNRADMADNPKANPRVNLDMAELNLSIRAKVK
uniref:Uncharacterized protein n=1 Tax=Polyandrocarpa misakiensis TaxID=7723 RepID=Q9GR91_POLMI|nr:hypothetical protein [Polyandrocarpa misakiensis]